MIISWTRVRANSCAYKGNQVVRSSGYIVCAEKAWSCHRENKKTLLYDYYICKILWGGLCKLKRLHRCCAGTRRSMTTETTKKDFPAWTASCMLSCGPTWQTPYGRNPRSLTRKRQGGTETPVVTLFEFWRRTFSSCILYSDGEYNIASGPN